MTPLYTSENTRAAYQLNWSLSLFGTAPLPAKEMWLDDLVAATELDGVRILSATLRPVNVVQFFLSTKPSTAPSEIVRTVKARLQYLIRHQFPKAFRRNYHIQSVGDAKSSVLDQYVARQTSRHPMADPRVQALLEACQFSNDSVDLARLRTGTYGQYLNSLHVVLENADGWNEIREAALSKIRDNITCSAKNEGWKLSRIGLLSNHIHILLGAAATESPESVALLLMNRVAAVYDSKPWLKFSYYVGTFGGYDRGAIRVHLSG
jgi:REP element-mobilizing transposase RayT